MEYLEYLLLRSQEQFGSFQIQDIYSRFSGYVNETFEYTWQMLLPHKEIFVTHAETALRTIDNYSGYVFENHLDSLTYICATVIALLLLCHILCYCAGLKQARQPQRMYSLDDVFDIAKTAYEPGHMKSVMSIVDKYHLDVNRAIPSSGMTLFLCACVSGQRGLVNFMLDRGADVQSKTMQGDSALYLATFAISNSARLDITLLELLIKAGCDVNAQNLRGNTSLHQAAMKGNPILIRTLLEYGADPYIKNCLQIYPFDCAINSGHVRAAQLLEIKVNNQYVWDVVDPYTPSRIALGLRSAYKHHLVESTIPRKTLPFS
ncbi:E3 ubiquitin-protein ligase mib1-like isoform X2 [Ptychodera flava]